MVFLPMLPSAANAARGLAELAFACGFIGLGIAIAFCCAYAYNVTQQTRHHVCTV